MIYARLLAFFLCTFAFYAFSAADKVDIELSAADQLISLKHDDLKRDIITLESWISQLECVIAPLPCALCRHTDACPKSWSPHTIASQTTALRAAMRSVIGQTRRLASLKLSNGAGFQAGVQRSRQDIHALLYDGLYVLRKLQKGK